MGRNIGEIEIIESSPNQIERRWARFSHIDMTRERFILLIHSKKSRDITQAIMRI